jgi:hypothetical protein
MFMKNVGPHLRSLKLATGTLHKLPIKARPCLLELSFATGRLVVSTMFLADVILMLKEMSFEKSYPVALVIMIGPVQILTMMAGAMIEIATSMIPVFTQVVLAAVAAFAPRNHAEESNTAAIGMGLSAIASAALF